MIESKTVTEAKNADLLCQALHKVKLEKKNKKSGIQLKQIDFEPIDKKKEYIKENTKEYLKNISNYVGSLLRNKYPTDSIKEREEGSIHMRITINDKGRIVTIDSEDKYPERLYLFAKSILEKHKMPVPPKEILGKDEKFIFDLPINFTLPE